MFPPIFPLYIDPGTGSMLFSLFIGIAAVATFGARALLIKLKFLFSGGKVLDIDKTTRIPYVIFSDHKRYWNVFKGICDEFEKRGIDLVYYAASEDDPVFEQKYNHVKPEYLGEGNKPYVKLNMLACDVLLATTPGLDVYQWKRSPGVKKYVHVPHSVDELAGYRMFGLDYYDAILTSSEEQNKSIRTIESLRPNITKKDLCIVGSLPLDFLKNRYDAAKADETKNIDYTNANTTANTADESITVLLAPSWGETALFSRYGKELMANLEKTNFHVIVRPHPQSMQSEKNIIEPLMSEFKQFEWNFDNDNFNCLNRADILITDFSAIVFDYAFVFNKPIIYSISDFNTLPYDADWLDEVKWSLAVLPDLGVELKKENISHIEQLVRKTISSTELQQSRAEVSKIAWMHVGESAKRTVDYLLLQKS